MKIEIYSDIACPWCYLGQIRLERALAEFPGNAEVAHRPYQLNPAMPFTPQSLLDYYLHRYGPEFRDDHAAIADMAKGEGLEFHMDRAQAVNTLTAHRLLWLAERDYGLHTQHQAKHALMRTYFTDGGNVSDLDTLVALAAEAGMDPAATRTALTGNTGTAEVRAAIQQAQNLGIRAVPTYVFNGQYGVQGAQEPSAFRKLFHQLTGDLGSAAHPSTCSSGPDTSHSDRVAGPHPTPPSTSPDTDASEIPPPSCDQQIAPNA